MWAWEFMVIYIEWIYLHITIYIIKDHCWTWHERDWEGVGRVGFGGNRGSEYIIYVNRVYINRIKVIIS
jgi:hypothetical protein